MRVFMRKTLSKLLQRALALSLGIAIQNFPEGAIISMPLRAEGESKRKAFLGGVLSGVVEPIGAIMTILVAQLVIPALPYLLSFAAGAMYMSWLKNYFRKCLRDSTRISVRFSLHLDLV